MQPSRCSEVALSDEDTGGLTGAKARCKPSPIRPPAEAFLEQLERQSVDGVELSPIEETTARQIWTNLLN